MSELTGAAGSGHGRVDTRELRRRAEAFVLCGSCDAGLPTACVCPDEDPRAVIADLLAELDAAREREREVELLHQPWTRNGDRTHCPTCGRPLPHNGREQQACDVYADAETGGGRVHSSVKADEPATCEHGWTREHEHIGQALRRICPGPVSSAEPGGPKVMTDRAGDADA